MGVDRSAPGDRTTGSYIFTITNKEGKPELARGNWIDMLRREGNQWKVRIHAFTLTRGRRAPECQPHACS
jgi:hypothetical protein